MGGGGAGRAAPGPQGARSTSAVGCVPQPLLSLPDLPPNTHHRRHRPSQVHHFTADKKEAFRKHVAEGLGLEDPDRIEIVGLDAGSVVVHTRVHGFESEEAAHAHHAKVAKVHEHMAHPDKGFGKCKTHGVKVVAKPRGGDATDVGGNTRSLSGSVARLDSIEEGETNATEAKATEGKVVLSGGVNAPYRVEVVLSFSDMSIGSFGQREKQRLAIEVAEFLEQPLEMVPTKVAVGFLTLC